MRAVPASDNSFLAACWPFDREVNQRFQSYSSWRRKWESYHIDCPFTAIVGAYKTLGKLTPEDLVGKWVEYRVLIHDESIGYADIHQEPEYILIEFVTLQPQLIILPHLVSSVNSTHPFVVTDYCIWCSYINLRSILLHAFDYPSFLGLYISGEYSHLLVVHPHSGNELTRLLNSTLSPMVSDMCVNVCVYVYMYIMCM